MTLDAITPAALGRRWTAADYAARDARLAALGVRRLGRGGADGSPVGHRAGV